LGPASGRLDSPNQAGLEFAELHKGVRVVHQLSVPGEDESREDVPPFSEEVGTRLVHNTYGWDGYIHEPDLKRIGICCSGGGIRSAAYGLCALQVLRTSGYLAGADYLAAMSGGDYISVAHTVLVSETLKAHTPPNGDPAQTEREYFGAMVPWALSSPEEEHFRNRSSYIAPGVVGKVWFALNLLYGMIRHLLPFAAIIFLTSFGFAVAFGDSARQLPPPSRASAPRSAADSLYEQLRAPLVRDCSVPDQTF
jgi:hypothetical protein